MNRRDFLKRTGAGAAALGLAGCKNATDKLTTSSDQSEKDFKMETRMCGNDSIGILGYGCMRWQKILDDEGNEIIDQQSVNELVDYALAHGVNYYDSSPVYIKGKSEEATAKALLRHPRDSYYIATKLSNFSNWSYENSVLMYRRSLEIYQTDHIDFYLLHSISGLDDFKKRFENNGIMEFLLEERRKGNVRNLGFSFHGDEKSFDELLSLHDKYHWDFVQIQMNYIDWNHPGERNSRASYLYEKLAEKDIPVVIMEPLLGGRLSDVPAKISTTLKTANPQGSIASWAFRFCGTFPKVLTILSGMTYMEHLQDNVDTFGHFQPLDQKELDMLEDMALNIRDYPLIDCTGCQYCMPCPYGIDIPGIFRHYNKCVNEGTLANSPEQQGYRRLRRKYLASYCRSIEKDRQADHCIACGRCVDLCPQHIRIPAELSRIDRYIDNLKQQKEL